MSFSLLMFISGILTTVTFTAMMQCSKLAPTDIQATHYTFLATLEVCGKLLFSTTTGYLVDSLGYIAAFLIFLLLASTVLVLFRFYPQILNNTQLFIDGTELKISDSGSESADDTVSEVNGDDISEATQEEPDSEDSVEDTNLRKRTVECNQ